MVAKIISATEAKVGTNIMIDNAPYTVKKVDVSKTGKHGHSKVRIEAVGILNDNKKIFVVPGHDRLEVPMVNKNKAQVLSIGEKSVSAMDLDSYETLEVPCSDEIKNQLGENSNIEYWEINGEKIAKRKL